MTLIIIVFGLMTLLAGVVLIVNPEAILGLLRSHLEKVSLQVLAVGVRVILGILLILYADASRYPLIIAIIGWLSIVAAATFSIIGRRRFVSLMTWALSLLNPYGRVGGLIAMGFGGFLVYAFV